MMSEDMRDSELDDRINSWLDSVVPDDFSVFSGITEDENFGRPCMNCSMRGRRSPPNLRKMDIPAYVLRARKVSAKVESNRRTSAMQGVRQKRPDRGKGRGRMLMEREVLSSERENQIGPQDARSIIEIAELKQMVGSLTDEDLARLRRVSSFAREAKSDNERLKTKLMSPPKETTVRCWICVIEVLIGKRSKRDLMDYPLSAVLGTCVPFEVDNLLLEILKKKMEKSNVAQVMAHLTSNSWLSTISGDYVCDYLNNMLGISTEFAMELMQTADGLFDPKELDDYIQSIQFETNMDSDEQEGDMQIFTTSAGTSNESFFKGFCELPDKNPPEIKSREEFPELSSIVTVKKNLNAKTRKLDKKKKTKLDRSGDKVSVSEDAPPIESDTALSKDLLGPHLVIFNLPEKSAEHDLPGALSAFGNVVKVASCGLETKVWFEDASILEWAKEALHTVNPLTGEHDENIKCVVVDPA